MSRPARPVPTPAHEQHDRLLVAQLAAGDPLEPDREQEAHTWLASCPECAALAADLRGVAEMVAREPVPPRRRDFRLTPEQAERSRGNAVARLIRRMALPRARAFAPAAAGILSVGLVFVVAGYAWPDEGAITTQSQQDVAPVATEPGVVGSLPSAADAGLALEAREPEAPAPEAAAAEAIEAFAADAQFLEEAAEHQAGTSDRDAMRKAVESTELADSTAADGVVAAGALGADDATEEEGVARPSPSLGSTSADMAQAPPQADELAAVTTQVDGQTFERWLILIGVALAVVGAALLLLGWLARRADDPLLR